MSNVRSQKSSSRNSELPPVQSTRAPLPSDPAHTTIILVTRNIPLPSTETTHQRIMTEQLNSRHRIHSVRYVSIHYNTFETTKQHPHLRLKQTKNSLRLSHTLSGTNFPSSVPCDSSSSTNKFTGTFSIPIEWLSRSGQTDIHSTDPVGAFRRSVRMRDKLTDAK